MTPQEEICYLTDLLLQATRWQCSEGEQLDPLQLEVKDRLARLTGQPSINVENVPSDKVVQKERKANSNKKHHDKYKETHVRVGKTWVLREDAVQVPRANGTGWKWALKESQEPPEDEHHCLSY